MGEPKRDGLTATEVVEGLVEAASQLAGLVVPGAGVLGSKAARLIVAEHQQRTSKAMKAAERISGLSREDLDLKIAANPASVPMLVKLLRAAGNNGHDRILRTMGAAYARALMDPSRLDYEELLLLSISNLEDVHVVLLGHLEQLESPVSPEDLARGVGLSEDLVRLAGTGLFTASLVETPYGRFGGGEGFAINATGRLVLKAVREASV